MTLRIYLDTSVVSACVDTRDPVRQELTLAFWELLSSYEPCISPFVLKEIEATPDEAPRREMLVLTAKLRVLPTGEETERLVAAYMAEGAFASTLLADARHVAAAVVADIIKTQLTRPLPEHDPGEALATAIRLAYAPTNRDSEPQHAVQSQP